MSKTFIDKLPFDLKKYNIKKIETGASTKIIYKIFLDKKSFIGIDFNLNNNDYDKYLYIHDILSKINISIPKIINKDNKNLLIISEDFGSLRYDKILKKQSIKSLLQYSVDTLLELNKNIVFDNSLKISKYNRDIFKSEIEELPNFYFKYIKLDDKRLLLKKEFIDIWMSSYDLIDFDFKNFCHKDFNLNNLIFLPSRSTHLKCGVIDFQDAFWGESCWDLFSLLEDSRVSFSNKYNEEMIEYFYLNTNQKITLHDYKLKYHFLNCSRQTRLLGRWVKLAKKSNIISYLDFIYVTKKRLKSSLFFLQNKELNKFYNDYIL
tara:strand:+ start:675 stop:1634 length:960 start_codon:yes stop_codon:yes gene_type:complete